MSFIRKIKRNGKTYLAEVESKWENGRPVQKYIRYVGKEVDGKQILSSSISNIEVDSVKLYGPIMILDHIAKEIGLHEILGEYSNEILSMVYAHCVEPRSVNQMTSWFAKTDLNHILKLDTLTEQRLLEAMDSLEGLGRDSLQSDIFEAVRKKYNIKMTGVFYDVTNTYLYGKKCVLGKLGHSKHGKNDKPLVQIGLAVTREEGIPVFHTVHDGNVHDSRILLDGLIQFKRMKIDDIIVVYDRGISSKEGLEGLKNQGLDSICGLPIRGDLKTIVRKMQNKNRIVFIDNRVKLSKTIFYAIDRKHRIGTVDGKLLICYNDKMKQDIRESRYDEVTRAERLLKQGKMIKDGLGKYFNSNDRLMKNVLTEAEEFDGYSCLFSTRAYPNAQVIRIYFEKDLVEKAFRNLNGVVSLRPIRHWLYDRVVGHIFICYLALLLLSLFKRKLEIAEVSTSVIDAMRELETLYKVYLYDKEKGFRLERVVRMSKLQENIVKAVDKQLLKT